MSSDGDLKVHIAGNLLAESAQALLEGSVDLILVRNFLNKSSTDTLRARGHDAFKAMFGDLGRQDRRQRLGTPLSEALKSEGGRAAYWSEVQVTEDRIAQVLDGVSDPLMRLDGILGGSVSRVVQHATAAGDRRAMLSRIMRRWPSGGVAHAHIDPPHNEMLAHLHLTRRLAANVYLDNGTGGDVLLWFRMDFARYRQLHSKEVGGVPHELVGCPSLAIHPSPGDLIVFDSSILHAVAPRLDGPRLTLSTFYGVDVSGGLWRFA